MNATMKKRTRSALALVLSLVMMLPQSALTVLAEEPVYTEEAAVAEQSVEPAAEEVQQEPAAEPEVQEPVQEVVQEPVQETEQEAVQEEPTQESAPVAEEPQQEPAAEPETVQEEPAVEEPSAETAPAEPENTEADAADAEEEEAFVAGTVFHYEDQMVKIVVQAAESAQIPADAVLHAEYMDPRSEKYLAAVAELDRQLYDRLSRGEEDVEIEYVLYDIYFTSETVEGRIEPNDKVKVTMEFKTPIENEDVTEAEATETEPAVETIDLQVVHLPENGQAEIVTEKVYTNSDGDVTGMDFFQDTFSPTGLAQVRRKLAIINSDIKTNTEASVTKFLDKNNLVVDGTGILDAETYDGQNGYDISTNNKIVRSWDSIKYVLDIEVQSHDDSKKYADGTVKFTATIPADQKDNLELDMDKMAGFAKIEDPVTNSDGSVTYEFYYNLPQSEDGNAIPGEAATEIVFKVGNKHQGEIIQPSFTAELVGDSAHRVEMWTPDRITVTSAAFFNVILERQTYDDLKARTIYNFDGNTYNDGKGDVEGFLATYGIAIEMANPNYSRGIYGIDLPDLTKPITVSVDLSAYVRKDSADADEQDITTDYQPLLYNVYQNGLNNQFVGDLPLHHNRGENYTGDIDRSCMYGGDVEVSQNGNILSFTFTNIRMDMNNFPTKSWNEKVKYALADGTLTRGILTAFNFEVIQPVKNSRTGKDIQTEFGESLSLYTQAKDTAMSVTSQVGGTVTTQTNTTDDEKRYGCQMHGAGNYDNELYFSSNTVPTDGTSSENKGNGSDATLLGSQVRYTVGYSEDGIGGTDIAIHTIAYDQLVKFDDVAFQPYALDGSELFNQFRGDSNLFSYSLKYAGKKGGWNHNGLSPNDKGYDSEMLAANLEDLRYYDSIEALQASGDTCVGILYRLRGINTKINSTEYSSLIWQTLQVKTDENIINYPYAIAVRTNAWLAMDVKAEDAQSLTTHEGYQKFAQDHPDYFDGNLFDASKEALPYSVVVDRDKSYSKAKYDEGGYKSGETMDFLHGDTMYISSYQTTVQKKVAQEDSEGNPWNTFNVDSGQRYVDYSLAGDLNFNADVTVSTLTGTTVTIVDVLPKGVNYMDGSAYMGGTYSSQENAAGIVTGGSRVNPAVTNNDDGTTTLVWTYEIPIDAKEKSIQLPVIHYSCLIGDPLDASNDVKNGDNLNSDAKISTTEDKRAQSLVNHNETQCSFAIIKSNAFNIYKGGTTSMEVDGQGQFDLVVNNATSEERRDVYAIDFMPQDQKGRTIKKGDYEVTSVTINQKKIGDLSDVSIYYTKDSKYADKQYSTANAVSLDEVKTWSKATINVGTGTVTGITGWPTAIAYVDDALGSNKTAHVVIEYQGNTGRKDDFLSNVWTSGNLNSTATNEIYSRSLSGYAWEDADKDGLKDETEKVLKNIRVELQDKDGKIVLQTVTDENGYYQFGKVEPDTLSSDVEVLHAGDYKIIFYPNNGDYTTTTKNKDPETKNEVNSKADGTYADGSLTNAYIEDVHMKTIDEMKAINIKHHDVPYQNAGFVLPDPKKEELTPGEGKTVKPGDQITYQIIAYNTEPGKATMTITDSLDSDVEYESSTPDATSTDNGTIIWELGEQESGTKVEITLTVRVKENAVTDLHVDNRAFIQIGNKDAVSTNIITNPEEPFKTETKTKGDDAVLNGEKSTGNVKVYGEVSPGDEIEYSIHYYNGADKEADVVIVDTLDDNVEVLSSDPEGIKSEKTITWNLKANAHSGGSVTLTVKVLDGAVAAEKVDNVATVKVGENPQVTTKTIENPVLDEPKEPKKKEISSGDTRYDMPEIEGTTDADGTKTPDVYGSVKVGDEITYEITYQNTESQTATVVITDTLENTVNFIEAGWEGFGNAEVPKDVDDDRAVTWTISNVPARKGGVVTLKVKVNENAKTVAKIDNTATEVVKIGNTVKSTQTTNTVENPLYHRSLSGIAWFDKGGDGTLVETDGDYILSEIKVNLYKTDANGNKTGKPVQTTTTGTDGKYSFTELDPEKYVVEFEYPEDVTKKSESSDGTKSIADNVVEGDKKVAVITTAKLPTDTELASGDYELDDKNNYNLPNQDAGFKIVFTPEKKETKSGTTTYEKPVKAGTTTTGTDGTITTTPDIYGSVKVGDEITYEITYLNTEAKEATVVITDILPETVDFKGAGFNGAGTSTAPSGMDTNRTVTWTITNVPAGKGGTVTLTVVVNDKAKTVTKIDNTAKEVVKIDDAVKSEQTTNTVENQLYHRSIEGYVWTDTDKDGYREDGEPAITGEQKVVLYKVVEEGDKETAEVFATTDLDETGHYSFTDLPAGEFYVVIDEDSYVTKHASKSGAPEGSNSKAVNDPEVREKENTKLTGKITGITLPTDAELASDDYKDKLDENNNYNSPNWDAGFVTEEVHKTEKTPGAGNTVQVGDQITYEISYYNTHASEAVVVIADTLDANVKYLTSSNGGVYDESKHTVTWTIAKAPAQAEGKVTLTVEVLEGAVKKKKVENTATVQIGNDAKQTTETIVNPADGTVTRSLEGTAWMDENKDGRRDDGEQLLAGKTVKLVDKDGNPAKDINGKEIEPQITDAKGHYRFTNLPAGDYQVVFEIDEYVTEQYAKGVEDGKNSKAENAPSVRAKSTDKLTAVITKITLPTDDEIKATGKISYNLPNQDAGFITYKPHKTEEDPGDGKAVKVGEEITYKITYENLHAEKATVTITDNLDPGVDFVSATDDGTYDQNTGTVTWTIKEVSARSDGYVLLKVKVNAEAVVKDGVGKVVNTASVQVGNDAAQNTEEVQNPVPENPVKTAAPTGGNSVKAGDTITYTISYRNYEKDTADVVIEDVLDPQVTLTAPAAADTEKETIKIETVTVDGKETTKVTWTVKSVPAGDSGEVTLTVKVKEGAEKKVDNVAEVTVGNQQKYTTNIVTHPIPPVKTETKPGAGKLVQVGEKITYEISYINYKQEAATVTVTDYLDKNVKLDSTSPKGAYDEETHTVTWTVDNLEAGKDGKVSLTVEVQKSAEKPEKVENQAGMKVGNDDEIKTDIITNPVEVKFTRSLQGTAWKDENKDGIRDDGEELLTGTEVTLRKKNETTGEYEDFRTATTDENGHYSFTNLPAGEYEVVFHEDSYVTKKDAETEPGRNSKAENNPKERKDENDVLTGVIRNVKLPTDEELLAEFRKDEKERTLTIDEDNNYDLPYQDAGFIDEEVHKTETAPGDGEEVKVKDQITYEISYFNTHSVDTKVTVTDALDKNVKFIEASGDGKYDEETHTVTWTIDQAKALTKGTVTLTVEVLLSAAVKPRQVENTAAVQIGNDKEQTTETVTNPVNPEFDRVINGTAWFDQNRDGIRQDDDELLKDVTVVLYKKDEKGTYVKVEGKTAKTDEKGYYEFTGLPAGDYQVVFEREQGVTKKSDTPDGKNSIAENLFDADGNPVSAVISSITLPTDDQIEELIVKGDLKSTTYVKEYQDAGFVKKLTAEPGTPSPSLEVTKNLVLDDDTPIAAGDASFYVALFADANGEELIAGPKELSFTYSSEASVVFDSLLAGETYYVRETDEKGNVREGERINDRTFYNAEYENGGVVEMSPTGTDASCTFANRFSEVPDGFYFIGNLSITKQLRDAAGKAKSAAKTFRAGIFADSALTQPSEEVSESVVELDLNGESSVTVNTAVYVSKGKDVTLYIAELDENGKPVGDGFAYTVTVDKTKLTFTTESLEQSVTIVNQEKPEATPTPTATPTPGAGTATPAPVKTADDTPVNGYLLMLFFAAGVITVLVSLEKKRKKAK